jgi:hypothetical protein
MVIALKALHIVSDVREELKEVFCEDGKMEFDDLLS